MCGIAGFIDRINAEESEVAMSAMLKKIQHRGPDGEGRWKNETSDGWTIAFGHRRLSIIDLEGGAQPLGNADESIEITFNGEIYNYQILRKDLQAKGFQFKTHSDTEVIVQHYADVGIEGVSDLNGMFAFGIWDSSKRRFYLSRDRSGIKPLYYCPLPSGGIAFASELSALMGHPKVSKDLDWSAVASYFFSDYVPSPQAMIQNVRKMQPGTYLEWSPEGGVGKENHFWNLSKQLKHVEVPKVSDDQMADELWDRLKLAVKRQMIADVPVGVFLSGGIDSSVIATLASQLTNEPLKTFSITFEDKDYDEGVYARLMATHLKTQHTELMLNEQTLLDNLDASLSSLDEPMADPSLLPTYLLAQLASKHVKVALGGDAGDELWAGYPTYKAHRYNEIYRKIPKIFRNDVIAPIVRSLPVNSKYQSFEWKAKRFVDRWDSNPLRCHLRWMSNLDVADLGKAFSLSAKDPQVLSSDLVAGNNDNQNELLALDFQTYMPGSVLTKVDRATMANGLEARPPFLDNDFIDWSFSQPYSLKMRGSTTKYLLKKAALKHLPSEIVLRRKKGFGIPLARWLKGPLKKRLDDVMASSPLWKSDHVKKETFSRWYSEHMESKADRSKPLWALIVLDHWLKKENVNVV